MKITAVQAITLSTLSAFISSSTGVQAQESKTQTAKYLSETNARLEKLEKELKLQKTYIEEQQRKLRELQTELADNQKLQTDTLEDIRAGQAGPSPSAARDVPPQPVGVKSEEPTLSTPSQVAALPEGVSVLTGEGKLVLTPSIEYTNSSANRLVFRGVQIVPGIQLGLIDANDVADNSVFAVADARYGLTKRLEVELRVPYVYRTNRLTTLAQQVTTSQQPFTMTQHLTGQNIGDVEVMARYQLNDGGDEDSPIYVASLRVKTPTGTGPFDVGFDEFGVSTSLPTGSGYWAAGPGISVLVPSDPVVLFGSVSYLHGFSQNVNKLIGQTPVRKVSPGDSIDASLGFGFALNSRFSFSLGYAQSIIFPTKMELGNTIQKSNMLNAGSLTFGWSYQIGRSFVLSSNFQFGVTNDAPDLQVVIRMPFTL